MNEERLPLEQVVETVPPEEVSKDWDKEALKARRWNVSGKIVGYSDAHGLCYNVEHLDGTRAWYEPREVKAYQPGFDYSPEEREEMLKKMSAFSDIHYTNAARIGVHAFIEFAGLMNEFITICSAAHLKGLSFPTANTHSGTTLPFNAGHCAYIAEKLNCIYGPALLASEANRETFIQVLFDGEYRLVKNEAVIEQEPEYQIAGK